MRKKLDKENLKTGGSNWANLPKRKTRFLEKINKSIGRFTQVAYTKELGSEDMCKRQPADLCSANQGGNSFSILNNG